jgi:hypothetical protein
MRVVLPALPTPRRIEAERAENGSAPAGVEGRGVPPEQPRLGPRTEALTAGQPNQEQKVGRPGS